MREPGVLRVVRRLERAGIDVWVGGGWGVDALVGRQTRRHSDLDLLLDCAHERRAVAELAALGYRTLTTEPVASPLFPRRVAIYDAMGRSVDLHPVELAPWLATTVAPRLPHDGDPAHAAFAEGRIGGSSVRCLSPTLQIAAHEGYDRRDADWDDVRLLEGLPPAGPR
jgi:lincosamide nucleotidyltransferase A/C/D/E